MEDFPEVHLEFAVLSIEWNSIRLGGPAHGIANKTVCKTLPGRGGRGWGLWGAKSV